VILLIINNQMIYSIRVVFPKVRSLARPEKKGSTANVSAGDAWMKQILHVFAYDEQYVEVLQAAYDQIDASTKGNTIVYITRTDGEDAFMYY
jgi:hypothetical protein